MIALPLPVPHVRVAGLHLRALSAGDAAAFHAIVTQEAVGRMLFAFPADWSLDLARAVMESSANAQVPPYRVAIAGADGRLIGSVGFAAGEGAEIAFFLSPDQGGQGIMQAALRVFLRAVFATYDMAALRAVVYHDNAASKAVLGHLGFEWRGAHVGTCSPRRCGAEVLETFEVSRAAFASA
jgi:RimJ/RimL family protein N-acetyltransferase